MESLYYAHSRIGEAGDSKPELQSVKDHLEGTAKLCSEFASQFGAASEGKLIGLAHDIGKCTKAFQKKLLENGPKTDHSTAGAILCLKEKNDIFAAACVAGHHSGLPNFGNPKVDQSDSKTVCGRIKKGIEKNYLENCEKCDIELPKSQQEIFKHDCLKDAFITKMLYSCLVDADFLDTEEFMNFGKVSRGEYDDFPKLLDRLNSYVSKWKNPTTKLNRLRTEILETCENAGKNERGIYTLTVPTGGGKTIASLSFALNHAVKNNMQHIVYVVPYTTIIEQNAKVFSDILGSGNVLEHHCGVLYDIDDSATEEEKKKALATENWDMPVIVTTAVQFFESIYSNKSSKCRKIHNLANSVVIFDEAQMLPMQHLAPCIAAVSALPELFNSTVVLCTATQPVIGDLVKRFSPSLSIREICPQSEKLFDFFKRVRFEKEGVFSDDELSELLSNKNQVLCVVNSRKAANTIYKKLSQEGSFHLSTLMVPEHRMKTVEEIRKRLKGNEPCRVVSTSLIEAGVDLDFPAVFRELSGLDSILQAAGRCNREGKRTAEESIVTVFERTEKAPSIFSRQISSTKEALSLSKGIESPEAIKQYFKSYRSFAGDSIDKDDIIRAFQKGVDGCYYPFEYVAKKFHLIDNNTKTVYVPYGEGADLIKRLKNGERTKKLFRGLGKFSVNIYENHYKDLFSAGDITVFDDFAVLENMNIYDEKTGLSLSAEFGKDEYI